MDPKLVDARMQIASEIGPDIGYFTPPGEKRFTGIELMIGIGGAFLFSFLKGLAKKAGEKIGEHVGDALAEYLSKKIDELIGKDRPAQDQMLEDAKREAQKKISDAGLTKEQVHALAIAIEAELTKVLAAQAPSGQLTKTLAAQAPPDVSARIARKVSAKAVSAL